MASIIKQPVIHLANQIDTLVPAIAPVFNKTTVHDLDNLTTILTNEFIKKQHNSISKKEQLIQFVKRAPMAVVSSKKKGVHLNQEKRRCFRHTFGPYTVEKLTPVIEKILSRNKFPPFKIDPSHGDLLGYQGDPDLPGHFGIHRDSKNIYPFSDDNQYPHMFTVLLILSSNVSTKDFSQGGTKIWLVPIKTLEALSHGGVNSQYIIGKELRPHLSPAVKRQYVIFPSNALHESVPISNPNIFKLALKLDLWVQEPNISDDYFSEESELEAYDYSKYEKVCKCSLCSPFAYPLKKEIIKRTLNEYIEIIRLNKLPIEVVEYICEFLVDKSNNNKCLNKVTCGCYNCVMDEVYQEYSQDYSEEEYCNGYDKY